jgi:hypothetical protein
MDVTELICNKSVYFNKEKEFWNPEYSMLNKGSPELEVLEFLYSFVRLIKPRNILETGTYHGGSAAYMAFALKENQKGKLTTLEYFPQNAEISRNLFKDLGIEEYIDLKEIPSLDFNPGEIQYQLLFLDSEPQFRLKEMERFLSYLDPGGFVFIHDLHPHLVGVSWDDFRLYPGNLLKNYDLQFIGIRAPRGFSLFQKFDPSFLVHQFLKEE